MRLVSFLYQVLAIILALTLLSLMTAFGWLGSGAQGALQAVWKPLYAFYLEHKEAIDRAATVIGVAVSVVTGTQAIMKSWYYAELNLPDRMRDLMERLAEKNKLDRVVMIAAAAQSKLPKSFLAKDEYLNPFSSIWERIKTPRKMTTVQRMANSIESISKELKTLEEARSEAQKRKVTAHLLRGIYFERISAPLPQAEARTKRSLALREYEAALAVAPEDMDALQYAAEANRALGDGPAAVKILKSLTESATKGDKPVRQAWARRHIAQLLHERATDTDWNEARIQLRAAIDALEGQEERKAHGKQELAECYKMLGMVQTDREKFTAARTALENAEYYGADVRAAFKDLQSREKDTGEEGE